MSDERSRVPGRGKRKATPRPGNGRLRQMFKLSPPAAIYIRELTRSRLQQREITADDLNETVEQIVMAYARADRTE